MRILEWNLNYGGDEQTRLVPFIKDYIKGFDVLVFTEVVLNENLISFLVENSYNYYSSKKLEGDYKNQVVIAVNKELQSSLVFNELLVDNDEENANNFLQVLVNDINIIGTRVLSLPKDKQYNQCKQLAKYINNNRELDTKTIILGDFNCGELRGNEDAPYVDVKHLYEYTRKGRKSDLRFYNFHLIRDMFDNHILKETMGETKSWGISLYQGLMNYGGAKLKNDLVIYSKDLNINSKYSWDFVRENEGEYRKMLVKNINKYGNLVDHGYPDHAILSVEIL